MEDLLRIADRTEGLPDQALAQLTQAGGIEGVIAASEMKARNDIRQEASAMQNMQQPPVINQLLATAMRPTMPAGPMAQVPMQQPMPDPMMTLQSMQPAPMPMAKVGGLVRRFQSGTQGTIGLQNSNLDNFFSQLEDAGVTEDQYRSLSPVQQEQLVQSINDRTALQQFGMGALQSGAAAVDAAMLVPRVAGNALQEVMFSRFGRAVGLSDPGDTASLTPFDASQRAVADMRAGLPPVLTRPSLNVPMSGTVTSGQQPSVTTVQPSTTVSAGVQQQTSVRPDDSKPTPDNQTGGLALPPPNDIAILSSMYPGAYGGPMAGLTPQNIMSGVDAAGSGATPSTSVSNTLRSRATGISDEMFKDLIDREKQYKTEVDNSLNKLKDLEAELPSKENIKDRIKKQTDLGVASAFFNAAGNATPSFIETISRGLAGASNVMNKFSGQEQKELYQYAIDAYGREKEKANTAYQRQQDNLKRINDARTLEATYATADAKNQTTLATKRMDLYFQAVSKGLEVDKFEAEQRNQFRDDVRAAINDFNSTRAGFTDVAQQLDTSPEQASIRLAVGGYEQLFVPEARRLVNNSIKEIIPRLARIEESVRQDATLSDSEVARQVSAQMYEQLKENNEVGHEAVLNKYGAELGAIARARPEDKAALLNQFKQRYRWLDDKYISSAIPNI